MHFNKVVAGLFGFLIIFNINSNAQNNTGRFSGDLNLNANFYQVDSLRTQQGLSFYDNLKSGAESWLSFRYQNSGFEAGVRFDLYNNSNRIFPTQTYTAEGIGNWYISKSIDEKLTITGGYFYDQFGSGALFRANEQRLIGIDRAVFGLKLEYEVLPDLNLKAFTGRQKYLFELDPSILKGANAEYYKSYEKFSINPGIAFTNRTLDQSQVQLLANGINQMSTIERFVPNYNTYAGSIYNTLTFGDFTWFAEYALKSKEAINTIGNTWRNRNGSFLLSNLTYSKKGFGITLQAKRADHFRLRTNPLERNLQNNVWYNYLPAINKEHTFLLLARYPAQALELEELAFTADIVYSPNREWKFEVSASNISTLTGDSLLYRELYGEVEYKKKKSPWKYHLGFQLLDYNDEIYRQKNGYVNTITPFVEVVYKFNRKTALRIEAEYLMSQRNTRFSEGFDKKAFKQDRNDWYNILAELTFSPHWSFSISDLYNINPDDPNPSTAINEDNLHFPGIFSSYTYKATRFSLFYGKRVDGIVCSGGVCRFEPAFSGVQFQLSTSF